MVIDFNNGLSEKDIDMLYIEHNNFIIIHTPIIHDENKFDISRSIFEEKTEKQNPCSTPIMSFIFNYK